MRIHISVFSAGVGHATRAVTIAKALARRGHTLTLTASGEAADFLRREGYDVTLVPMVDTGWSEDGGVSVRETAKNMLKAPSPLTRQISIESRVMGEADAVISDSKLSPIIASRLLSKPCLLITNQLMLTLPASARRMRISVPEKLAGFLLSAAWSLADQVVVPDLPPPSSISYLNLAQPLGMRVSRFIGPILDWESVTHERRRALADLFEIDSARPTVFIQVSGNQAARVSLTGIAEAAADELGNSYNIIIAEGNPRGDEMPVRENWGWRMEWCPYPDVVMSLSHIVVSRAGHTTISRALALGKPLVLVPIRNHSEQLGNANQAKKLGVAESLGEAQPSPEDLVKAIRRVIDNDAYRTNAERLARLISSMNAVKTLVRMIENLVNS